MIENFYLKFKKLEIFERMNRNEYSMTRTTRNADDFYCTQAKKWSYFGHFWSQNWPL